MCSIVEILKMYHVVCRHRKVGRHCIYIGFYQISLCIVPFLSCLYLWYRGHCNVGQDRVKIVSTSQPLYRVFIVDIVDIAMVTYIDFTSYLHCFYYLMFKLTASQCWSTPRRYRFNVLSLLSSLHRRHRNVNC